MLNRSLSPTSSNPLTLSGLHFQPITSHLNTSHLLSGPTPQEEILSLRKEVIITKMNLLNSCV